jgi:hypothetical protein
MLVGINYLLIWKVLHVQIVRAIGKKTHLWLREIYNLLPPFEMVRV